MKTKLTWAVVDSIAEQLGVGLPARRQWRSRGVPPKWCIEISERLTASGSATSPAEFKELERSKRRVVK